MMAADPYAWRNWATTVEGWEDVPPPMRDRLSAFLAPVLVKVAELATALDGGTDVDVIAALAAALTCVGSACATDIDESVLAVFEESMQKTDAATVRDSTTVVHAVLEHLAAPIAYVTLALLLERVIRATVQNRAAYWTDVDVLVVAADALELQTRGTLVLVASHKLPAASYQVM